MINETLALELPPVSSAYVEVCQNLSALQSKEIILELRDDDRKPPEPPHGHEHIDDEEFGAFQEDAFERGAFQTGI